MSDELIVLEKISMQQINISQQLGEIILLLSKPEEPSMLEILQSLLEPLSDHVATLGGKITKLETELKK